MRINTNISLMDKKRLELSGFLGVDFSSSALDVATKRASSSKNFINIDGINAKRSGWKELYKFPYRVNGIHTFKINGEEIILVYAGKKFYRVSYNNGEYSATDVTLSGVENQVIVGNLIDRRSSAFVSNDKIWILGCGDYLVFGKYDDGNGGESYQLRRVENNIDTYIPNTTIGIRPNELDDISRSSLDSINMLNIKRKNGMLGSSWYVLTKDDTFQSGKTYYTKSNNVYTQATVIVGEAVISGKYYELYTSFTYTVDSGEIDSNTIVKVEIINASHIGEPLVLTNSADNYTALKCNNVQYGTIVFADGAITLNNVNDLDLIPVTSGEDNIIVTYEYAIQGLASRIRQCTFGVPFGYGSASDRLFVSGNENCPNNDFYTEIDDFSNFPEDNATAFGTTGAAIMAYSRLGDGTLAILKEDNVKEPTIYFRTASTYEDRDGNTRTIFPIQAGALGEGAKSSFATANLSGDNIFLSNNGVYGIVLSDNIVTNERYARERSRHINTKLLTEDLSNAVGIVYKNRYYLAIEDAENKTGNCYVLDSRYKSTSNGDMPDTFNYECWYWDNIPARVWNVNNDKLYFGTSEGRICVFDNEYSDRTYQSITPGNLTIDFVENKITINTALVDTLKDNHLFKFNTNVYAKVIDPIEILRISDNKIYTTPAKAMKLAEYLEDVSNGVRTDKVYLDNITNIGESDISVSTEYRISDLDLGDCSFRLEDVNREDVLLDEDTRFRICENIKGEEVYVANFYEDTFTIKHIHDGSETIDLVLYNNGLDISANTTAQIIYKNNVVCEWYSPILDLGANDYSKDLESIAITLDPTYRGVVQFGYETKIVTSLLQARQIQSAASETRSRYFTFEDIDFNNFSFDTAFASSYTKKIRVRNFNYIMFKFKSSDDKCAAVHSINLTYKIYKKNRGVR